MEKKFNFMKMDRKNMKSILLMGLNKVNKFFFMKMDRKKLKAILQKEKGKVN